MFSIFSFYSVPSFASGIEADSSGAALPADCDSDTLDTTSGTANLRADFEANRIDLRWYDSNTLLNVSSTSSDKCTYDTTISLPTNPTKTGYTFKGWKVRPEYDFSTLPTSGTGTEAWSRNEPGHCLTGDSEHINTRPCDSRWNDLQDYEWKVIFNWGTVYGMGLCSSTAGTTNGETRTTKPTPAEYGLYCWCKATGYKANGGNIKYASSKNLPWVYVSTDPYRCYEYCADYCSFDFIGNRFNIISTMFGH